MSSSGSWIVLKETQTLPTSDALAPWCMFGALTRRKHRRTRKECRTLLHLPPSVYGYGEPSPSRRLARFSSLQLSSRFPWIGRS